MKTTSQPRSTAEAFTLVELLTVIAIIAILMGLLFPAIGIVKEQARKVQAKTDVTNIVAAVKQYYTEYGKYPPVVATATAPTATAPDDFIGDVASGAGIHTNALFNTLRSISAGVNENYVFNPRRIVFFEGKIANDPVAPRSGFSDNAPSPDQQGFFYDPWGKEYNIVIDSNYDNTIDISTQYSDFTDTPVRVGCGAFSMGKDNKLGTNDDKQYKNGTTLSDDVISWQ